jgi:hypothetical protein
MAAKKYRVMPGAGPISLRQSPDKTSPKYEEWFDWTDGDVFTPPPHMKSLGGGKSLDEAVALGMLEEVS